MPRNVLIDVIYINAYIPPRMPNAEATAARRTLRGPRFMGRLRQAVQTVFGRYASLQRVRVTLTR